MVYATRRFGTWLAIFQLSEVSTPNIRANVRQARLNERAVCDIREKLKLSSEGGDSGRNKCKRGNICAYSGIWRSLR
jgi:hypothetical protein